MVYDDNDKMVKSLDKRVSDREMTMQGAQTINFCSWDRLRPYLEMAAGGKPVKGVRVDDSGLEIILDTD